MASPQPSSASRRACSALSGANHHLRQPLVFLDMPILHQPEAYISKVGDLLDADGRLTSDATKDFLKTFADTFADWIALSGGK